MVELGHRRRPRSGGGRGRVRHAAGRGRRRGPSRRRDRRRAGRGRGHRRRGPGRPGPVPDRRPLAVLSGDHPLVAAEVIAGLVETHAEADADATVLTTESLDPAGLRPRHANRRTGSSTASSRPSAPRACPRRCWPTARSTSAPTSSSPGRCSPRSSAVEEQDGELYLTGAITAFAAERRVATSSTTDADVRAGRQRPRGPDGGRAPGPPAAGRAARAERRHLRRARHDRAARRRDHRRGHAHRRGRVACWAPRRSERAATSAPT